MVVIQHFELFTDFLPLMTKKQFKSGNCHNSRNYKILHNTIEVGQYR